MIGTRPGLPNRRQFLASASLALAAPAFARNTPQRVVVIMCDGFGLDYLDPAVMPVLGAWRKSGIFRPVQGAMPSVTNTNNASICCGVWAEQHGITGNSYLDEKTGREEYMETLRFTSGADAVPTRPKTRREIGPAVFEEEDDPTSCPRRRSGPLRGGAPAEWVRRLGPRPISIAARSTTGSSKPRSTS